MDHGYSKRTKFTSQFFKHCGLLVVIDIKLLHNLTRTNTSEVIRALEAHASRDGSNAQRQAHVNNQWIR